MSKTVRFSTKTPRKSPSKRPVSAQDAQSTAHSLVKNPLTFAEELAFLTKENASLKAELQETSRLLVSASTNSSQLHASLLSQQQSLSNAIIELDRLRSKKSLHPSPDQSSIISFLESQLAAEKQVSAQLLETQNSLRAELTDSKQSLRAVVKQMEIVAKERDDLRDAIGDLEIRNRNLENEKVKLRLEIDEVQSRNSSLTKELEQTKSNYTQLSNTQQSLRSEYSSKLSEMDQALKKLQYQLSKERQTSATLRKSAESFQQQLETYKLENLKSINNSDAFNFENTLHRSSSVNNSSQSSHSKSKLRFSANSTSDRVQPTKPTTDPDSPPSHFGKKSSNSSQSLLSFWNEIHGPTSSPPCTKSSITHYSPQQTNKQSFQTLQPEREELERLKRQLNSDPNSENRQKSRKPSIRNTIPSQPQPIEKNRYSLLDIEPEIIPQVHRTVQFADSVHTDKKGNMDAEKEQDTFLNDEANRTDEVVERFNNRIHRLESMFDLMTVK